MAITIQNDEIKNLLDKGIAYKTEDGIYFSIKKFNGYVDYDISYLSFPFYIRSYLPLMASIARFSALSVGGVPEAV